jgi:N-acetylglucosamine malate deacetylase 2
MWTETNRIVVVAAHPDDETIGMGAQLASLGVSLQDVTLIHVTDGAPRHRADWKTYAQVRRAELLRAVSLAGIPPERCIDIGLPDQQASRNLIELSCHLSRLFDQLKPQIIFTHAFEGGHPDHDATCFAVHHAACSARVVEFSSYHRAAVNERIETGCFLEGAQIEIALTEEQKSLKRRMFDCFASQRETLAWFRIDHECFRRAPSYDFTRPPHSGRLFYELFDWGISPAEWLRLVRHAQRVMESCLSR